MEPADVHISTTSSPYWTATIYNWMHARFNANHWRRQHSSTETIHLTVNKSFNSNFNIQLLLISIFLCKKKNVCDFSLVLFGNRHVKSFSKSIQSLEKIISVVYDTVDHWTNYTQKKWLYLDGIINRDSVRTKMPVIAQAFDKVDNEYVKVCYMHQLLERL